MQLSLIMEEIFVLLRLPYVDQIAFLHGDGRDSRTFCRCPGAKCRLADIKLALLCWWPGSCLGSHKAPDLKRSEFTGLVL